MNERERRAAELVSCVSAGCLLLIGAASCLAGACVRWPSASKTAGVIVLAAAACLSSVWIGKKKKEGRALNFTEANTKGEARGARPEETHE